jgi:hypothetical protein
MIPPITLVIVISPSLLISVVEDFETIAVAANA